MDIESLLQDIKDHLDDNANEEQEENIYKFISAILEIVTSQKKEIQELKEKNNKSSKQYDTFEEKYNKLSEETERLKEAWQNIIIRLEAEQLDYTYEGKPYEDGYARGAYDSLQLVIEMMTS